LLNLEHTTSSDKYGNMQLQAVSVVTFCKESMATIQLLKQHSPATTVNFWKMHEPHSERGRGFFVFCSHFNSGRPWRKSGPAGVLLKSLFSYCWEYSSKKSNTHHRSICFLWNDKHFLHFYAKLQ